MIDCFCQKTGKQSKDIVYTECFRESTTPRLLSQIPFADSLFFLRIDRDQESFLNNLCSREGLSGNLKALIDTCSV